MPGKPGTIQGGVRPGRPGRTELQGGLRGFQALGQGGVQRGVQGRFQGGVGREDSREAAPLTLVAYGMIPTTEALVPMHQAEMQNMVRLCSTAQRAGENGGKRKHSELINSPNKKVRHLRAVSPRLAHPMRPTLVGQGHSQCGISM